MPADNVPFSLGLKIILIPANDQILSNVCISRRNPLSSSAAATSAGYSFTTIRFFPLRILPLLNSSANRVNVFSGSAASLRTFWSYPRIFRPNIERHRQRFPKILHNVTVSLLRTAFQLSLLHKCLHLSYVNIQIPHDSYPHIQ